MCSVRRQPRREMNTLQVLHQGSLHNKQAFLAMGLPACGHSMQMYLD